MNTVYVQRSDKIFSVAYLYSTCIAWGISWQSLLLGPASLGIGGSRLPRNTGGTVVYDSGRCAVVAVVVTSSETATRGR